jgi:hypothetical protein
LNDGMLCYVGRAAGIGRLWAVALGVAAAGWGFVGCSPTTSSPTGQTGQTAKLAVGVHVESLVDTTRATPADGSVSGHPGRLLQTTIFYPAQAGAGTAV